MKKSVKRIGLIICAILCLCMVLVLSGCGCSSLLGKKHSQQKEHEHSYTEWQTVKEETCTEAGLESRKCSCGEKEEREIPASHALVTLESVAPACDVTGYDVVHCERCGQEGTINIVLATGHKYGTQEIIKEATCLEDGYYEASCETCGAKETKIISATGHAYMNVTLNTGTAYQCKNCGDTLNAADNKAESLVEREIFNCDLNFAFDVYANSADEVYSNLKIVEYVFYGTEYEEALPFDVTLKETGIYTVSPTSDYEYATTYVVELSGSLEFYNYKGSKLNFSTKHDKNHESVYEYSSKIVYIKALENTVGGYYPYSTEESGDYLYLTIPKVDGIEIDDIICLGEATTREEILDPENEDCIIAKVYGIMKISSDEYKVILVAPEMDEVFDALDISYEEAVKLSEENIDIEDVTAQLEAELLNNDEFIKLLATVNVASERYLSTRNLSATTLSNKSFLDYLTFDTNVKVEGFVLTADVCAKLDVPVEDKAGVKKGSIVAKFDFGLEVGFDLAVDINLFSTNDGVSKFDIRLVQKDKIDIDFEVSIDIEHSAEEQPYVLCKTTDRIHRKDCPHVNQMKPENREKLTATQAQKLLDDKKAISCLHCQSTKQLSFDVLLINENTNKIHSIDCYTDEVINLENRVYSEEEIAYWTAKGYTCCQYCTPDELEKKAFDREFLYTLEYADWNDKCNEIKDWLGTSEDEYSRTKGVKLVDLSHRIFLVTINLDVYYILDFDLDATLSYKYSLERETTYGLRLNNETGRMETYKNKKEDKITEEFDFIGSLHFQLGVKADLYASFIGFESWVRAGITAEAGVYADMAGVLHLTPNEEENYAGAYLEAGIYLDIEAYYKLFSLKGDVTIYANEWPLISMGYNKVYYAYDDMKEELYVEDSVSLEELLTVKGFDLKTMALITETINHNGIDGIYSVTITFEDGTYFYISGDELVLSENAPCSSTDTMTIRVETTNEWTDYDPEGIAVNLKEYVIVLYADNHNYVETFREDATCISDGKIINTCQNCGNEQIEYYKGEHLYSSWSYDRTTHTRTCSRCNEVEQGEHLLSDWYSKNETTHIKDCSVCDYEETGSHTIENKKCTTCDYKEASEGLLYSYESYYDGYAVTGLGTCTETEIVIPPYYRGRPVISVSLYDAINITSVVIPKTVTKSVSFGNCINLEKITFLGEVPTLSASSFTNCLKLVEVQNGIGYVANWAVSCEKGATYAGIRGGTVGIANGAFADCTELSGVGIPSSVKIIGASAFKNCAKLETVNIPEGVEIIDDEAFSGCKALSFVTLPDSLKRIGKGAFASVPAIELADGVNYIDNWALGVITYLSGLSNVREGTVGIADYAFANCNNNISYSTVIPDSVKYIGQYAYYNCSKLEYLVMGVGVERIEKSAFENCGTLKTVKLPATLEYLGDNAFCYTSIAEVELGANVESVGSNAFTWAQSFSVDASNPYLKAVDGVLYTKDGKELIAYPRKRSATSYTILDGTKVIRASAFQESANLQSVFIPSSVEHILANAFDGCKSLSSISVGGGLRTIGVYAFRDCHFNSISLPNGVNSISYGAFQNSYLSSFNIPSELEVIFDNTFYGCTELKQITIPSNVKIIGKEAFATSGLVQIVIPSTVERVEEYAFLNCDSLLSVYIEKGVDYMGDKVFYSINNSATIRCGESSRPSAWSTNWLKGYMDKYGREKDLPITWGATN